MKLLKTLAALLLLSAPVFGQTIQVDSDEYQQAKANGTLGNFDLEYVYGAFTPAKTKPVVDLENMTMTTKSAKSTCDCYVEPDTSYTLAMAPNDDGSSPLINIPFNFCFYGQTFTSFYINNNGNITFSNPLAAFSSTAFPSNGNEILAPFWADVDTRAGNGQVLYKITPTAVYINWEDVGYFSQQGDKLNTFQLIITDGSDPVVQNGNVAFCYQDMQWTTGSASQGVNGFGGIPATCGANKGDNVGYFLVSQFDHAGVDFDGALGNPDGISWLDYKSFFFDICGANNVPPVPEGVSNCDTFRVCSFGDTADISINFLSPEQGQTTSITYNNGGLTSMQEISNTAGNTAQLVLRIIGDPANAGSYTVTVTGTDDFAPTPGVTTLSFVIVIEDSAVPLNPVLSPTVACDSINVGVLNGPYDTYLWDDFATDSMNWITQSGVQGVTVSLNGCYKRVTDTFTVAQAPIVNLQGALNVCGPNTTDLFIPDSLNLDSAAWLQGATVLSNNYSLSLGAGTYSITIFDSTGFCSTDTTFTIAQADSSIIFNDTLLCNGALDFQVTGLGANPAGTWFSTAPEISFSNANIPQPLITTTTYGTYVVNYVDDCQDTVTAEITFAQPPSIFGDTSVCNLSFNVTGTVSNPTGGVWSSNSGNISFSPSTSELNPTIDATASGVYQVNYTDNVCGLSDSATIEFVGPPSIFGDTTACNYVLNVSGTQSYNGGIWSASDTSIHFNGTSFLNPETWTSTPGTYVYTFTDTVCNVSVNSTVTFPPYVWTQVVDTVICLGSSYELHANDNATVTDFLWSTGETGPMIVVSEAGQYSVTASNVCHSATVTATIGTKICDIEAPNVISLSSTSGNNLWTVQQQGLTDFTCTIVNRWGNLIYEFTDPNSGWSGQTMSGNIVEEGVYFYIIKAKLESGDDLTKQGFIQVVH